MPMPRCASHTARRTRLEIGDNPRSPDTGHAFLPLRQPPPEKEGQRRVPDQTVEAIDHIDRAVDPAHPDEAQTRLRQPGHVRAHEREAEMEDEERRQPDRRRGEAAAPGEACRRTDESEEWNDSRELLARLERYELVVASRWGARVGAPDE